MGTPADRRPRLSPFRSVTSAPFRSPVSADCWRSSVLGMPTLMRKGGGCDPLPPAPPSPGRRAQTSYWPGRQSREAKGDQENAEAELRPTNRSPRIRLCGSPPLGSCVLAPPSAAPYDRIRTTPTKPTTKTKRLTTNARQTTTGQASSLVPEDSPSPSERTLCGNERITALNSAIDQLGPPDIELTPNSIMTRITEHYVSQSVTNEREHKSGSHVPNNFLGKKGPAHPPPAAVPPWPAAPPRLPRIPPRLLVAPPQPAAAALRWPAPPTSARPGWRLSEKCQLNVRKYAFFGIK